MVRREGAATAIDRRRLLALAAAGLVLGLTSCATGGSEQLRKPLEAARSSVESCLLALTLYADGSLARPTAASLLGNMTHDLRDAATTAAESGSGVDGKVYADAVAAIRGAADAAASAHSALPGRPADDVDDLNDRLTDAADAIDAVLAAIGGQV